MRQLDKLLRRLGQESRVQRVRDHKVSPPAGLSQFIFKHDLVGPLGNFARQTSHRADDPHRKLFLFLAATLTEL